MGILEIPTLLHFYNILGPVSLKTKKWYEWKFKNTLVFFVTVVTDYYISTIFANNYFAD